MSGIFSKIAATIAAKFRIAMILGIIAELYIFGVNRMSVTAAMLMLFAAWVPSAISAFFGFNRERTLGQNLMNVFRTFFNGIVYSISDYWLAWLCWLMVAALLKVGLGHADIFVWMWIFNILAATTYLIIDDWTSKDITQAGAYRAAIDETLAQSKPAGILYIVYVAGRAIAWDGPERIILVFKKELDTPAKRLISLLGMTFLQALIWTKIYSLGTETVSEAVKIILGR